MAGSKRESLFLGLLILVLGILFMLRNIGWHFNVWHLVGRFWPLILIYIGAKNIYLYLKKKS
jgi:hypothetical protein